MQQRAAQAVRLLERAAPDRLLLEVGARRRERDDAREAVEQAVRVGAELAVGPGSTLR